MLSTTELIPESLRLHPFIGNELVTRICSPMFALSASLCMLIALPLFHYLSSLIVPRASDGEKDRITPEFLFFFHPAQYLAGYDYTQRTMRR